MLYRAEGKKEKRNGAPKTRRFPKRGDAAFGPRMGKRARPGCTNYEKEKEGERPSNPHQGKRLFLWPRERGGKRTDHQPPPRRNNGLITLALPKARRRTPGNGKGGGRKRADRKKRACRPSSPRQRQLKKKDPPKAHPARGHRA